MIRAALPPLDDPAVDIATLASQIHTEEEDQAPSVVKAVGSPIGPTGFARSISPAPRRPTATARATTTSASTPTAAPRWSGSAPPPSPLEQQEKLEQLRALEAGMRIDITLVDSVPRGVDTPSDLETARKILAKGPA